MERDFTESSKQQLLKLVKEVEDEKWCDLTDWVGDRWYDFENWIGKLDIKNYINDVNAYHKKVIDKNNTTAEKITEIFDNVNAVSNNYKKRFESLLSLLQSYRKSIYELSEILNPSNGKFVKSYIQNYLTNKIEAFVNDSSNTLKTVTDGLNIENNESKSDYVNNIINITKEKISSSLTDIISALVDFLPGIKIGNSLNIPIDANTTLCYKVSASVNNMSDADLNFAIEDNQLKFKDFSYSTELKGILNIGFAGIEAGPTISVNDNNTSLSINQMGGIEGGASKKIGNTTYSLKISVDSITSEYTFEESVTTELDSGSITSTISIKKSNPNRMLRDVPEPSFASAFSYVIMPQLSSISSHAWDNIKTGAEILTIVGGGLASCFVGASVAVSSTSLGLVLL